MKNLFDLLAVVAEMPIRELGSIAEKFVNVMALRHQVTPGLESVGGPVDVALISAEDVKIYKKRDASSEK